MEYKRLLFIGLVGCLWCSSKGMEEKGVLQVYEPRFYMSTIENNSQYDVIVSHNQNELFRVDLGQKVEIMTQIPLERYDIPSTNQVMYKLEGLRIKPENKKSFFVSLYFAAIVSEDGPCITSGTNMYLNTRIFHTKTLDENYFLENNLPNEDIYTVTAKLYLQGKRLHTSRCKIAHKFQPMLQPTLE